MLKAITILQPWASLIACGAKQIETRGWETKYRGKIAIHAGKKVIPLDKFGIDIAIKMVDAFHNAEIDPYIYPVGEVIAIADLVDCVMMDSFNLNKLNEINGAWLVNGDFVEGNELAFGDYTPGRYAWILKDIQAIKPIPAKGQQRIWNWAGDVDCLAAQ